MTSESTRQPPAARTNGKSGGERAQRNMAKLKAALSLIDRLSGGQQEIFLRKLIDDPEAVDHIASELSVLPAVEVLRKLAKTSNIMTSDPIKADYNYVGLPIEASQYPFFTGFEKLIIPKLGERAKGFSTLFHRLNACSNPLIIETGCLRVPGNWEGDGQSTFLFDWYAREKYGHVLTIDINPDSIDSARRACSSVTSTILNDSISALDMLSKILDRPASLLYFDSFDLDLENPMPSAIHHAMEMMAARRLIGSGTLICVDDFSLPNQKQGGKGLIVDQFLATVNAKVLYEGYQKIWEIMG
ncbi:hypothetical protein [Acetobacter pasteurianus]|nr:hypothetical protein [Acetobacter pasteurianus]